MWQSLVLVVYLGILFAHRELFFELKKDNFSCFVFMVSNLGLYLFGVVYNIFALLLAKYYKFFIKFAYVFTGILVLFSVTGLFLTNDMYELQHKKPKYQVFYSLLIWMLCIRLFFYMMICSFFMCFSVFVCCAIASGQYNIISDNHANLDRIPEGMKRFLKSRAKFFNPNDNEAQVD